jgi:hypothetical protein
MSHTDSNIDYIQIDGILINQENNLAVAYAYIILDGLNIETSSNELGKFHLNLPNNRIQDEIEIFIMSKLYEYITIKIKVKLTTNVKIFLKPIIRNDELISIKSIEKQKLHLFKKIKNILHHYKLFNLGSIIHH